VACSSSETGTSYYGKGTVKKIHAGGENFYRIKGGSLLSSKGRLQAEKELEASSNKSKQVSYSKNVPRLKGEKIDRRSGGTQPSKLLWPDGWKETEPPEPRLRAGRLT